MRETIGIGLIFLMTAGGRSIALDEPAGATSLPRQLPGLDNVLLVMDGLINGSAPQGDAGFDSLRKLGVKTILSVDGAAPDVVRAEARGIRYVHLPIAYGGIAEDQGLRIIRAIRDLPKPIYIHCFHGTHRSPSAAAFAAVGLGRLSNNEAVAFMHQAGASEKYANLYRAVETGKPVDPAAIEKVAPEFPTCFTLPDFVRRMSAIGTTWEQLEETQRAAWAAPADHPDLHPRSLGEALFAALGDAAGDSLVGTKPADFREMVLRSQEFARALAAALTRGDKSETDKHFASLKHSCQACHTKYRD